jgi:CBS domain-containing protein
MQVKDVLRINYLAISPNDTLSSVFGKLEKGKHTEAVALDDQGRYAGMLWKRALIRGRIDPAATKAKNFITKPATLTAEMPLEEAARLLHESDFHVLAVLDKGKRVLGICGARDVLDNLQHLLGDAKASEVGTMKLITLRDTDPLAKAVAVLHHDKIDHIPLIDGSGRLTGVASVFDIAIRFHLGTPQGSVSGRHGKHGRTSHSGQDSGERPNYDALPLQNVMSRILITASPKTRATDIVKLLLENELSDVILVEGDRPVGIVTTKDLLHEVSRA